MGFVMGRDSGAERFGEFLYAMLEERMDKRKIQRCTLPSMVYVSYIRAIFCETLCRQSTRVYLRYVFDRLILSL